MQYKEKDYGSSREISLEDNLVLQNRKEFHKIVDNFIHSPQECLIINFENTSILDTAGMGSLVIALQKIDDAKKRIVLRNPRNDVKDSLDIVNFQSLFTIEFTG